MGNKFLLDMFRLLIFFKGAPMPRPGQGQPWPLWPLVIPGLKFYNFLKKKKLHRHSYCMIRLKVLFLLIRFRSSSESNIYLLTDLHFFVNMKGKQNTLVFRPTGNLFCFGVVLKPFYITLWTWRENKTHLSLGLLAIWTWRENKTHLSYGLLAICFVLG